MRKTKKKKKTVTFQLNRIKNKFHINQLFKIDEKKKNFHRKKIL